MAAAPSRTCHTVSGLPSSLRMNNDRIMILHWLGTRPRLVDSRHQPEYDKQNSIKRIEEEPKKVPGPSTPQSLVI